MFDKKNIEIDFLKLKSIIYSIVKPDYLEGFIYSFFNLYDFKNPNIDISVDIDLNHKKNIIPDPSQIHFMPNDIRDDNFFDFKNSTIVLQKHEIEEINNSYFLERLNVRFNDILLAIESFNEHYFNTNKYTLIENYKEILNFINLKEGAYGHGKLKNIEKLDLNRFKDVIQQKNDALIRNLENKINYGQFLINTSQEKGFVKEKISRSEIINKLIGENTKSYTIFLNYEKKLKSYNYINDDQNKWLKGVASFIRFYVYCEKKEIFKNDLYQDNAKGVMLLRELYDFHEGDIDAPSKRKRQITKRTKAEFNFLDI